MTQDTRLVQLTAASKQLFSCQRARTDWNMSVLSLSATFLLPRKWVWLQPAATFLLLQQKSCQCGGSRVKQCSPSRKLKSWATKVASARLAWESRSIILNKHVPLMEKGHKMSTKASVKADSYTSMGQRRMGKGMQITLPINQLTTDILSLLRGTVCSTAQRNSSMVQHADHS